VKINRQLRDFGRQLDKGCSRLNPGLSAVVLVLSAIVMIETAARVPMFVQNVIIAAQGNLAAGPGDNGSPQGVIPSGLGE
jgi:hypothetical protein